MALEFEEKTEPVSTVQPAEQVRPAAKARQSKWRWFVTPLVVAGLCAGAWFGWTKFGTDYEGMAKRAGIPISRIELKIDPEVPPGQDAWPYLKMFPDDVSQALPQISPYGALGQKSKPLFHSQLEALELARVISQKSGIRLTAEGFAENNPNQAGRAESEVSSVVPMLLYGAYVEAQTGKYDLSVSDYEAALKVIGFLRHYPSTYSQTAYYRQLAEAVSKMAAIANCASEEAAPAFTERLANTLKSVPAPDPEFYLKCSMVDSFQYHGSKSEGESDYDKQRQFWQPKLIEAQGEFMRDLKAGDYSVRSYPAAFKRLRSKVRTGSFPAPPSSLAGLESYRDVFLAQAEKDMLELAVKSRRDEAWPDIEARRDQLSVNGANYKAITNQAPRSIRSEGLGQAPTFNLNVGFGGPRSSLDLQINGRWLIFVRN